MYYLCEKYYTHITVQYYIADCVSWVPRLTLLDLTNKLDLQVRSWKGTHLYVGDLLYVVLDSISGFTFNYLGNRSGDLDL